MWGWIIGIGTAVGAAIAWAYHAGHDVAMQGSAKAVHDAYWKGKESKDSLPTLMPHPAINALANMPDAPTAADIAATDEWSAPYLGSNLSLQARLAMMQNMLPPNLWPPYAVRVARYFASGGTF